MFLYLPGFSLKNTAERDLFIKIFEENNLEYYAHRWLHWEDEDAKFSFEDEIQRILTQIKPEDRGELTIIAKSIGTGTALRMIKKEDMIPKQLILMGIPLAGMSSENKAEIKEILGEVSDITTIIQNSNDPHGSFAEIKEFTEGIDIDLIELSSDNHRYPYTEKAFKLLN